MFVRSLPYTLGDVSARTPPRPPRRPAPRAGTRLRVWLARPKSRWVRYGFATILVVGVAGLATLIYLWSMYGRRIDASLAGEQRPIPRIFGRPFELYTGQG